jgi:hypothetical protein
LTKLVETSANASLAQSVERETLNLKVAGSTPAWGFILCSGSVWFENFLLFCLLEGGHGIALDTVLRSKDHSVSVSPDQGAASDEVSQQRENDKGTMRGRGL